ncbi:MAG: tetratricopeptide repeat protein [Clostridiaceae bacterium]|nr:tetratricopeptide repeat protein [Clostridiaceae bacterium]
MNAFEILGIPSTKDVKEIRRAYSKLMTQFSPEKDPEGFQRLRTAYEEAIIKAKEKEEAPEKIISPIDEFMEAFESNYRCFERRLDINAWEQLLEKDICYNIDSSKEVNHRILTFIMDDYNFPTYVWILFNNHFSWTAKKDSLYNNFPKNFMDFVVYKINNESTFNYEYLKQCEENQQDEFIKEYRNLNTAIDQLDFYTANTSIKVAQKICPHHPDLQILIGRYFSVSKKIGEADNIFTTLIKENKEDFNAFFYRAELYYGIGSLKDAYEDYKMVLKIKPNSPGVWYSLAKSCLCLEKYEDAIEYSEKLCDLSEYREAISVIISSAYNFYIDTLLESSGHNLMEDSIKFKLAKAYFKTSKIDESYNILKELMQSSEVTSSIYYLFCQVLISKKDLELAYIDVCKAVELFKNDYEINFLKADLLDDLGKYEEAIAQYDLVIDINKNQSSSYNNKAYVLNKINRYNEALDCANMAINLDPEAANSYKNKAGALLGLELYEDCLEACEQALNKFQYLTEAYIIKMKAFINMNLLDEALSVYNKISDYGLKNSDLYYQKARVLMYLKRYEEAIEYCDLAIELDGNNADFYYVKGLCFYYSDKDNEAIEWFEDTIKRDKAYGSAYFYKIKCLLCISKQEEALKLTNQAISLNLQYLDRFLDLKGTIMEGLKKYEEAIVEYKKAIEYKPDANYYYSVGHAYNELNKYSQAIEYYSTFVELEPNDVKGHINMSYSLYNLGKYKECIEYCNNAIEIDPEYALAYQNKGWALYKLNNLEKAEVECNIALKLNGDKEDVLLLKLRILKVKGLNQQALIVCDRMLELNENNDTVKNIRKELLNEGKNQKKSLFKALFK